MSEIEKLKAQNKLLEAENRRKDMFPCISLGFFTGSTSDASLTVM